MGRHGHKMEKRWAKRIQRDREASMALMSVLAPDGEKLTPAVMTELITRGWDADYLEKQRRRGAVYVRELDVVIVSGWL